MKKLFYMFIILIPFYPQNNNCFPADNEEETQARQYKPNVVIQGKIEEQSDYFGRKIYSGQVLNKGRKRADFVRIIFTMYDTREKEIGKKEVYINGSQYVFGDSTFSNSTLKINEIGRFTCYTAMKSDTIATYGYKIIWKDYKYD